ncbi:Serine/threonine-protein phosphatase PP1 isozyme 7 [Tritrichomonas foetus]|uniref:Serine/threonine-protein phosphatase n=1 Tax=Tritrichomonas foetus TaxID=1144522 RepID=A0A1J4JR48_9EUKA|nr:Serine/threonine-protein phosphatase PP1 isozyme 7 [Tritrichomonas foetus]|eukprot:OHS99987.1 Serine/threonine-protein phosphatase PP1 isozyme 7 [Tritrichomonas foetus]
MASLSIRCMNDGELTDLIFQVLISRMRRDGHCLLKTRPVKRLIKACTTEFQKEPTQLHLRGKFVIVGDLHGNIDDLISIFMNYGYPPETQYVLLGDYVDRGKNSIETLILLYALKLKFPQSIYLLRGNHESKSTKLFSGFKDECLVHLNKRCYSLFIKSFSYLPLAALLNHSIFCVHGGLSQSIIDITEIDRIEKPITDISLSIASDLLWSDPSPDVLKFSSSPRGNGCLFGSEIVDQFLGDNELSLIIRAHEFCPDGYKWSLENCLTVFSASDYMGTGNLGGVAVVSNSDNVKTFTFKKAENFKVIMPSWVFEESRGLKPFEPETAHATLEDIDFDATLLIL